LNKREQIPKWLEKTTKTSVYGLISLGTVYSLYEFGGVTTLTQILEINLTIGFLLGTYLLAEKNPKGWWWFALMNASMCLLMANQHKLILAGEQILSLCFVVNGIIRSRPRRNTQPLRYKED
jgi:hypothetical protein